MANSFLNGIAGMCAAIVFYGTDQVSTQYFKQQKAGAESRIEKVVRQETEKCNNRPVIPVSDVASIPSDVYNNIRIKRSIEQEVRNFNSNPKYEHKITESMIYSIIQQESSCDPCARSTEGAIGLMQVTPAAAQDVGESAKNLYALEKNIHVGTFYFGEQLNKFNGDIRLALAAYNSGPTLVAKLGRVPNISETKKYVPGVMSKIEKAEQAKNHAGMPTEPAKKFYVPLAEEKPASKVASQERAYFTF